MLYPLDQAQLISLFEDDEARWAAVSCRNSNADGFFVYGVHSTKIYCRPICKGRLARRANITFYATTDDAQAAGFRACKRCKPEVLGFMPEEPAVRKIRDFVKNNHIAGDRVSLSLSQMARQSGLSKWHFHRVFKNVVGVTPVEFARMKNKNTLAKDNAVSLTPDDAWLPSLTCSGSVSNESGTPSEQRSSAEDDPVDLDPSWTDLLAWLEDDYFLDNVSACKSSLSALQS